MERLALALLALMASGCSALLAQEAGGSYAVGKSEQSTVSGATYLGLGTVGSNGGTGVGGELRLKGGPNLGQVALGPMFFQLAGPEGESPVAMFVARAGFNLVQFESVEGHFGFGMFSPHLSAGVSLRLTHALRLFIMPEVEYDVRFTSQQNTGFVSLMIGIGAATYGDARRPPPGPVR